MTILKFRIQEASDKKRVRVAHRPEYADNNNQIEDNSLNESRYHDVYFWSVSRICLSFIVYNVSLRIKVVKDVD